MYIYLDIKIFFFQFFFQFFFKHKLIINQFNKMKGGETKDEDDDIILLLKNKKLEYKYTIEKIYKQYIVNSCIIIGTDSRNVDYDRLYNKYIYFLVKTVKPVMSNTDFLLEFEFNSKFIFLTELGSSHGLKNIRSFYNNNNIIWPSGITVFKNDIKFLKDIEIRIGENLVYIIDIVLLSRLFSYYVSDEIVHIPIPRKFVNSTSIDQKQLHYFNFDIEHMYGIPISFLQLHSIKFRVTSAKNIKYDIITEHTIFPDITSLYKRNIMMFSTITSYQYIKCLENDLYENVKKIRKRNWCYTTDFNMTKICFECFDPIVLNDENCKKNVYNIVKLERLSKSTSLSLKICELIIDYGEYDWNHEIIIYDGLSFYRMYDDVLYYVSHKCKSSLDCDTETFGNLLNGIYEF